MANYTKTTIGKENRIELHEKLSLTGEEISLNELPAGANVPFVHSHKENEEMLTYIIFYFHVYSPLIILCTYFKIALRMIAYRTYFRRLSSYHNMSAVTAFPYLNFALFKYL